MILESIQYYSIQKYKICSAKDVKLLTKKSVLFKFKPLCLQESVLDEKQKEKSQNQSDNNSDNNSNSADISRTSCDVTQSTMLRLQGSHDDLQEAIIKYESIVENLERLWESKVSSERGSSGGVSGEGVGECPLEILAPLLAYGAAVAGSMIAGKRFAVRAFCSHSFLVSFSLVVTHLQRWV